MKIRQNKSDWIIKGNHHNTNLTPLKSLPNILMTQFVLLTLYCLKFTKRTKHTTNCKNWTRITHWLMLFSNKYNTKYFGYINSFCKMKVTKHLFSTTKHLCWTVINTCQRKSVCHKNNCVEYITKKHYLEGHLRLTTNINKDIQEWDWAHNKYEP